MIVTQDKRRTQRAEPAQPPEQPAARSARAAFAAEPTSGTLARRFVAQTCRDWADPELIVDAELVVTELVENAIRHGRTGCEVTVELSERGLLIAVRDGSRSLPRRVTRTSTQPGGRGLLLVERLSRVWGFELDDAGKVVWALLAVPEVHNEREAPENP